MALSVHHPQVELRISISLVRTFRVPFYRSYMPKWDWVSASPCAADTDTRFQPFSSFAGKLLAKLIMKMPHDSHGDSLGYTVDQLVPAASQLRVEEAFDKVGTAV